MAIFREGINGKLIAYFKQRLGMYNYKNGWLKGTCPHCDKENKFGVNIGKDKTHCFVCEDTTKPLDLILQLEGLKTRRELFAFISKLDDVDPFESYVKPLEQKEVSLPEGFTLLALGRGILADLARKYVVGRGFDIMALTRKGWGYCIRGEYSGCIIMPFFSQGKLQYFIGRRFINNGEKFKNPEVESFGIGKSQLIYNRDALLLYHKVQVVESVMNAETIGDTAIAILGKFMSSYQKSELLRSPVGEVELILDPDAHLQSIQTAMGLVTHKAVKVIRLPDGVDVNDIGKAETNKLRKAAEWLSYQDLYKMFLFHKNKLEYDQSFS